MSGEVESETKWEQAYNYGTIYGLEEAEVLLEVLAKKAPTGGPKVREFEKKFAEYVGTRHAIAVSSWVAGAHLATIAIGIKPGDEVLVPAMTFQATANPAAFQGATIKFVEADRRTFNMNPEKIEDGITPKTRAIFPVHMCGQPCDMDPIMEIAKKHGLVVIEDAAHAPGAEYRERKIGSIGDITVFSFQQAKNMSTLGEGGMVTTDNDEYVETMLAYRAHGFPSSRVVEKGKEKFARGFVCVCPGLNYRMTDVQASVGIVQLGKLDEHNEMRRNLARYLSNQLKDIKGITVPYEMEEVKHIYHLYNILVEESVLGIDRDRFLEKLENEEGIVGVRVHYCPPVHLLEYYRAQGHREGECPITEQFANEMATLPMNPRLTLRDMDCVANAVKRVANEK